MESPENNRRGKQFNGAISAKAEERRALCLPGGPEGNHGLGKHPYDRKKLYASSAAYKIARGDSGGCHPARFYSSRSSAAECCTLLALSLEGRFQGCGFFHEQPRTHPTVVIPSAEAREICF
jgi:hypothetical protein